MPDMSQLVAVNTQMPDELKRQYLKAGGIEPARPRGKTLLDLDDFDFGVAPLPEIDLPPMPASGRLGAVAEQRLASDSALPKPRADEAVEATAEDGKPATPKAARIPLYAAVEATPRTGVTVTPYAEAARPTALSAETPKPETSADPEQASPVVDATSSLLLARALEHDRQRVTTAPRPMLASTTALAVAPAEQATDDAGEASLPMPTWTIRRGPFRPQALRWGDQDPAWTVHWLADSDPLVDIDQYTFHGPLDEVLIQAVQSLAASGAPIRIERARANHQLIIRSRKQ